MRLLPLLAIASTLLLPATAADPLPDATLGEVDLTWLNNCPGPWGHEERTQVGPVTVVTYECDDGGT